MDCKSVKRKKYKVTTSEKFKKGTIVVSLENSYAPFCVVEENYHEGISILQKDVCVISCDKLEPVIENS